MRIHIAFAAPTRLWRQTLQVPEGTTVAEALAHSDFAREFPEFTDHFPAIGIYGERCDGRRVLVDNDRIELYRPLVFDPVDTRRRRAGRRQRKNPSTAQADVDAPPMGAVNDDPVVQ
ncbi:RnfH family protein [Castellaniella sp.]|uniref:RnfH family protein n=1 Tax=Castellaniella sp. TaxID=1955812 RepID=UPI003568EBA8